MNSEKFVLKIVLKLEDFDIDNILIYEKSH